MKRHHIIEVILLGAAVGVGATWGYPAAVELDLTRRRGECALHADDIKRAEHAYRAEHGEFLATGWAPREQPDATAVEWAPEGAWQVLGFAPLVTPVRGTYRVQLTEAGFVVDARCDVDGDGEEAHYEATSDRDGNARLLTPDVY